MRGEGEIGLFLEQLLYDGGWVWSAAEPAGYRSREKEISAKVLWLSLAHCLTADFEALVEQQVKEAERMI